MIDNGGLQARHAVGNSGGNCSGASTLRRAAAVVLVLLFFSLSVDKAPQYALPALPGLALVAAVPLVRWFRYARKRQLLPLIGLFALAGCAAYVAWSATSSSWFSLGSIAAAALLGCLAIVLMGFARRREAMFAAALMIFPVLGATVPLEARTLQRRSVAALTRQIADSDDPPIPVILFRVYDPFAAIPLRLRRKVWLYQPQSSELYYATKHDPRHFPFLSREGFAALVQSGPAWGISEERDILALKQALPGTCLDKEVRSNRLVLLRVRGGCRLGKKHASPRRAGGRPGIL